MTTAFGTCGLSFDKYIQPYTYSMYVLSWILRKSMARTKYLIEYANQEISNYRNEEKNRCMEFGKFMEGQIQFYSSL